MQRRGPAVSLPRDCHRYQTTPRSRGRQAPPRGAGAPPPSRLPRRARRRERTGRRRGAGV